MTDSSPASAPPPEPGSVTATAAAMVPLRAVALALATADTTIHQEPPYRDSCPHCQATVELRELLGEEQWEALWT